MGPGQVWSCLHVEDGGKGGSPKTFVASCSGQDLYWCQMTLAPRQPFLFPSPWEMDVACMLVHKTCCRG